MLLFGGIFQTRLMALFAPPIMLWCIVGSLGPSCRKDVDDMGVEKKVKRVKLQQEGEYKVMTSIISPH